MSSWITGLADKAETILNKIDQNAATALHTEASPALDAMKNSLTSSTQSLKNTLSPIKRSSSSTSAPMSLSTAGNSASSSKSDGSHVLAADLRQKLPTSTSFSLNTDTGNGMDTHELAAFKIALNEITNERDDLRLRIEELNHDSENLNLKQRVEELELLTQSLTEERDKAVHDLNDAQTAHMAYVHSISELETSLAKLQQEYMSTAHKLQMQCKETEQQRMELQEYRIKAQRALQGKDALIAELKQNPVSEDGCDVASKDSETRFLQIEYDALKKEMEHSNEEQQKLRIQIDEYMAAERQYELELSVARQREQELNKELRSAREYNMTIESEQRMLTQELNSLRQQMSNQLAAAATRLHEKEKQLQEQRQLVSEAGFSSAKKDYENRLKALTQSLVERQGLLERITVERNALRLQYENMQGQLQQSMHSLESGHLRGGSSTSRNTLLSNTTDDVKAQFPLLMNPSPFDNRVARRFKRALRQADSIGIRVGAFLRRYPMMRICIILYVALLHIWVMFVLLSTTPN